MDRRLALLARCKVRQRLRGGAGTFSTAASIFPVFHVCMCMCFKFLILFFPSFVDAQVLAAGLHRQWIATPAVQLQVARESGRAFSSTQVSKAKGKGKANDLGQVGLALVASDAKAVEEASQVAIQHFRTTSGIMADADPRTHRPTDVGKVYPLPKKTIEGVFPEGLAGLMHKMLFGQTRRRHGPDKNANHWYDAILKEHPGVLIRKQAAHIISALYCVSKTGTLKGSPNMHATPGFLLDGPPGTGKSMILNHCVHWARTTGDWLVVFMPEPSRMVLGLGLFGRGDGENANKIYQPEFAETILKHIQLSNGDKMKQIEFSGSEGANCSEAMDAFFLQNATAREKNAVSVLVNVMKALKTQTAFPLLVAVDEINSLRGISCYMDLNMKPIPASDVVLAEIFGRFLEADYARGVVLGAATRTGLFQNVPLPPFNRKPIQVSGISRDELKNFLTFQQNMGELFTPVTDELLDYLFFVTSGRWIDLERMTGSEIFNLGLNNNPKQKKIGKWFRATKVHVSLFQTLHVVVDFGVVCRCLVPVSVSVLMHHFEKIPAL